MRRAKPGENTKLPWGRVWVGLACGGENSLSSLPVLLPPHIRPQSSLVLSPDVERRMFQDGGQTIQGDLMGRYGTLNSLREGGGGKQTGNRSTSLVFSRSFARYIFRSRSTI